MKPPCAKGVDPSSPTLAGMRGSVLFPTEGATLCEPGLAPSWLAEDGGASGADNDRLGMTKDRRDLIAAGAFDVHEVGVGTLNQPLQLAFSLLFLDRWVQKIFSKRHGVLQTWHKNNTKLRLKISKKMFKRAFSPAKPFC